MAVYRATNTIIVATIDGVEHAYHFTKRAASETQNELEQRGTKVTVYYSTKAGRKVAHFFKKAS